MPLIGIVLIGLRLSPKSSYMTEIVAYPLICKNCGLGKTYGSLEYLGEGLYAHFNGCIGKPKVRRERKLRGIPVPKTITVPQCTCIAGDADTDCPYYEG